MTLDERREDICNKLEELWADLATSPIEIVKFFILEEIGTLTSKLRDLLEKPGSYRE